MSLTGLIFNIKAAYGDKKRDAAISMPRNISAHCDISYGPHGESSLLDVYYPKGTQGKLPTIVSIHGGGYVYGSKEIYRRYGMDMASRGFAFVNFKHEVSVPYAMNLLNGIKLFGRPIKIQFRAGNYLLMIWGERLFTALFFVFNFVIQF